MSIHKSLGLSAACSPATLTIGCDRCSATNCARLIWHHKLARFLLADNVPLTQCSVAPASSVSRGRPTRSCPNSMRYSNLFQSAKGKRESAKGELTALWRWNTDPENPWRAPAPNPVYVPRRPRCQCAWCCSYRWHVYRTVSRMGTRNKRQRWQ